MPPPPPPPAPAVPSLRPVEQQAVRKAYSRLPQLPVVPDVTSIRHILQSVSAPFLSSEMILKHIDAYVDQCEAAVAMSAAVIASDLRRSSRMPGNAADVALAATGGTESGVAQASTPTSKAAGGASGAAGAGKPTSSPSSPEPLSSPSNLPAWASMSPTNATRAAAAQQRRRVSLSSSLSVRSGGPPFPRKLTLTIDGTSGASSSAQAPTRILSRPYNYADDYCSIIALIKRDWATDPLQQPSFALAEDGSSRGGGLNASASAGAGSRSATRNRGGAGDSGAGGNAVFLLETLLKANPTPSTGSSSPSTERDTTTGELLSPKSQRLRDTLRRAAVSVVALKSLSDGDITTTSQRLHADGGAVVPAGSSKGVSFADGGGQPASANVILKSSWAGEAPSHSEGGIKSASELSFQVKRKKSNRPTDGKAKLAGRSGGRPTDGEDYAGSFLELSNSFFRSFDVRCRDDSVDGGDDTAALGGASPQRSTDSESYEDDDDDFFAPLPPAAASPGAAASSALRMAGGDHHRDGGGKPSSVSPRAARKGDDDLSANAIAADGSSSAQLLFGSTTEQTTSTTSLLTLSVGSGGGVSRRALAKVGNAMSRHRQRMLALKVHSTVLGYCGVWPTTTNSSNAALAHHLPPSHVSSSNASMTTVAASSPQKSPPPSQNASKYHLPGAVDNNQPSRLTSSTSVLTRSSSSGMALPANSNASTTATTNSCGTYILELNLSNAEENAAGGSPSELLIVDSTGHRSRDVRLWQREVSHGRPPDCVRRDMAALQAALAEFGLLDKVNALNHRLANQKAVSVLDRHPPSPNLAAAMRTTVGDRQHRIATEALGGLHEGVVALPDVSAVSASSATRNNTSSIPVEAPSRPPAQGQPPAHRPIVFSSSSSSSSSTSSRSSLRSSSESSRASSRRRSATSRGRHGSDRRGGRQTASPPVSPSMSRPLAEPGATPTSVVPLRGAASSQRGRRQRGEAVSTTTTSSVAAATCVSLEDVARQVALQCGMLSVEDERCYRSVVHRLSRHGDRVKTYPSAGSRGQAKGGGGGPKRQIVPSVQSEATAEEHPRPRAVATDEPLRGTIAAPLSEAAHARRRECLRVMLLGVHRGGPPSASTSSAAIELFVPFQECRSVPAFIDWIDMALHRDHEKEAMGGSSSSSTSCLLHTAVRVVDIYVAISSSSGTVDRQGQLAHGRVRRSNHNLQNGVGVVPLMMSHLTFATQWHLRRRQNQEEEVSTKSDHETSSPAELVASSLEKTLAPANRLRGPHDAGDQTNNNNDDDDADNDAVVARLQLSYLTRASSAALLLQPVLRQSTAIL